MKKKIFISLILCVSVLCSCSKNVNSPVTDKVTTTVALTQTEAITLTSEVETTVPPPPPPSATVAFAGDVLIHSQVWQAAKIEENTYDFKPFAEEIKPYIEKADFAVCNLENPVDVHGGNANLSTYPMFNAPSEILDMIKFMGFDAVTTANNHAFDKGFDGLTASLKNVRASGLMVTGTNSSNEEYNDFLVTDVNGINIGIIGYSQLDNGLSSIIPEDKREFAMRRFDTDDESLTKMKNDMLACRNAGADIIILELHWGAEYVDAPTADMEDFARRLAENGADIVWGGHSHCVQPAEYVNTPRGQRLILYSLGNFFVDQIGLKPPQLKTAYGVLVTANIVSDYDGNFNISAEILPTYTYRYNDPDSPTGKSYSILPEGESDNELAVAAWEHVKSIIDSEVFPVSKTE